MTIHLEIRPAAGSTFDGTTFAAATEFSSVFLGTNHVLMIKTDAGDIGVFDLREMLAEIDATVTAAKASVVDKDATKAQNTELVTDVIVERGLVEGTGLSVAGTDVGSHTPPLGGFLDGVRDQQAPNTFATGNVNVARFGGSQYISILATGVRGGVLVLPTGWRFWCDCDGDSNPPVLHLWLIPLYGCECWSQIATTSEIGPPP